MVKKLKEGSAAEERAESAAEERKEDKAGGGDAEDVGPGGQDKAFPRQGAVKNPHVHGSQSKHPKKIPN